MCIQLVRDNEHKFVHPKIGIQMQSQVRILIMQRCTNFFEGWKRGLDKQDVFSVPLKRSTPKPLTPTNP